MGKLQKPATPAGITRQKDTAASTGIKQFFPPSQEPEPLEGDNMADRPTTSQENQTTSDSATEVGNNIEGILTALAQIPNKTDLHSLGSDLKHTIHMETATLKQELANVWDTLEDLEERTTHIGADALVNFKTVQKHDQAILDSRRHTEDLENRSRRCNIRIRGGLRISAKRGIESPPINIERIHRAGIQRGAALLPDTTKARNVDGIRFEESTVHLYQDLAVSTITQRHLLKPLTATLKDHNTGLDWESK
ncbi:hypothetical protein XELAEV_18028068mg [Xenopus laevis]|uniref:Uncharacterized protein n=1 Tax=Xenopus laevis TaxID=8355 RepID=A0A974CZ73_XENLA|nr:hypothetical protein XELAEV_18028068mg [Xenopus laevis]